MTIKIETSVVINKPVESVFEFMANSENDTQWQSGVLDSRKKSEGPRGVGTIEESEVQFLGRRIKSTLDISVYEPNRKIVYKTTSGPIPFEAEYIFDPLAKGETKVTFGIKGDASGFFKLAEPLVARTLQRQWETNLANLKDLLEAQT
jgi:dehydrogenase/reductase SDR family protein 12